MKEIRKEHRQLLAEISALKSKHLLAIDWQNNIGMVNVLINTCRANNHELTLVHDLMNRFWIGLHPQIVAHTEPTPYSELLSQILEGENRLIVLEALLNKKVMLATEARALAKIASKIKPQ